MSLNPSVTADACVAGLVSVIVPARNASEWIADALASVAAQDYQSLEVFVIDDGSTDDTAAIAQRFVGTLDLRIICGDARGPAAARNRGLDRARGEFVQFLDADDALEPWKIGRQVAFARDTGADVVWGAFEFAHDDGEGLAAARREEFWPEVANDPAAELMTVRGFIQLGALLVRRRGALANVRLLEQLRVVEDIRYQFALVDAGAVYVKQPGLSGFVMREHGSATRASRQSARDFWLACLDNAKDREGKWRGEQALTAQRARVLASAYVGVAHYLAVIYPQASHEAAERASSLYPGYREFLPRWLRVPARVLGLRRAEAMAVKLRSIRQAFR